VGAWEKKGGGVEANCVNKASTGTTELKKRGVRGGKEQYILSGKPEGKCPAILAPGGKTGRLDKGSRTKIGGGQAPLMTYSRAGDTGGGKKKKNPCGLGKRYGSKNKKGGTREGGWEVCKKKTYNEVLFRGRKRKRGRGAIGSRSNSARNEKKGLEHSHKERQFGDGGAGTFLGRNQFHGAGDRERTGQGPPGSLTG